MHRSCAGHQRGMASLGAKSNLSKEGALVAPNPLNGDTNMIEFSKSRLEQNAAKEWSKYAQEPVTVEYIKGHLYAYGSELACLRLMNKMRHGHVRFSQNLNTWFWEKETEIVPNVA